MQTLLIILACLVALLALAPQAWANSRHVVLAGYYRLLVALRGANSTLDRKWITVAVVAASIGFVGGYAVRGGGIPWPDIPLPVPIPNIEHGPRNILIVRESEQDTNTKLDSALVQLRNGMAADYLRSKQHTLLILDPDTTDASGNPPPALAAWREKFPSRQQPVLIISDKAGKVLYAEPLSEQATSQSILEIVKGNE